MFPSFPNLNSENCRVTSPATDRYNCISWAAGCNTKWWCPHYHWPPGVPREVTLSVLSGMFETLGYEKCENGSLESGYEKVALFASSVDDKDSPKHAARQLSNGWWTSKLGGDVDIEHRDPKDLNGPDYGIVVCFMRRAKTPST